MMRLCRKCAEPLIVGENVTQFQIDTSYCICWNCRRKRPSYNSEYMREYAREYNHRSGRRKPISENRTCSLFLGVHVAERVLSHVFKDVERMPYGNPGYDFICNRGKNIDVKSACRSHHEKGLDSWIFKINKNQIADYFLCLAFDNREDLNPEHIWLIPGGDIEHKVTASISINTLEKWNKYELNKLNEVIACCDTIHNL